MRNNRIRNVLDQSLSGMAFTDAHRQNVLSGSKGEAIVKRKISAMVAFALILVLMTGAAVAVISLRDTGRQVIETEQTDGYYQDWPADKKASLIDELVSLGYIEETAEITKLIEGSLLDDEAHRTADEAIEQFTGWKAEDVSFLVIMQAAWGPFEQWTKEEQAWYSQLMIDMGIQKDDHTLFLEPQGAVDEAQAIAIARRQMAEGFEIDEGVLDAYTVITSFQVPEFAEPGDDQPYWYVELSAPEAMPEEERPFNTMWVFIHPETGQPYQTVKSMLEEWRADEEYRRDPVFQAMADFEGEHGYFGDLSHADRALWSRQIRPLVQQKQREDPSFFADKTGLGSTLATVAFVYGVPDEKALSEADALTLAARALVEEMGREEAEIRFYTRRHDLYYDITDPERPLWKFFFWMPNQYDSDKAYAADVIAYYGEDPERQPHYKVELDAFTGEVVRAFAVDLADDDLNEIETFAQMM